MAAPQRSRLKPAARGGGQSESGASPSDGARTNHEAMRHRGAEHNQSAIRAAGPEARRTNGVAVRARGARRGQWARGARCGGHGAPRSLRRLPGGVPAALREPARLGPAARARVSPRLQQRAHAVPAPHHRPAEAARGAVGLQHPGRKSLPAGHLHLQGDPGLGRAQGGAAGGGPGAVGERRGFPGHRAQQGRGDPEDGPGDHDARALLPLQLPAAEGTDRSLTGSSAGAPPAQPSPAFPPPETAQQVQLPLQAQLSLGCTGSSSALPGGTPRVSPSRRLEGIEPQLLLSWGWNSCWDVGTGGSCSSTIPAPVSAGLQ